MTATENLPLEHRWNRLPDLQLHIMLSTQSRTSTLFPDASHASSRNTFYRRRLPSRPPDPRSIPHVRTSPKSGGAFTSKQDPSLLSNLSSLFLAFPLVEAYVLTPPASAVELNASVSKGSYYVTLGLFAMTIPGLWSLIQRTTKPTIRRRTFAVPGPASEEGISLNERAKEITKYFVGYNYRVDSMSDVITFVGNFQSSVGTASQLVLYSFICLGCAALVLSVQFPEVGNWWYTLTGISPLSGWYYWTRSPEEEEVKVKIVTSEDDKDTEIIIEGDQEELDRFGKELKFQEKGKVYVKGILEQ